jgi:hypothetical protein
LPPTEKGRPSLSTVIAALPPSIAAPRILMLRAGPCFSALAATP